MFARTYFFKFFFLWKNKYKLLLRPYSVSLYSFWLFCFVKYDSKQSIIFFKLITLMIWINLLKESHVFSDGGILIAYMFAQHLAMYICIISKVGWDLRQCYPTIAENILMSQQKHGICLRQKAVSRWAYILCVCIVSACSLYNLEGSTLIYHMSNF